MAGEVAGGTVGKALGLLDEIAARGRPVRFAELLAASRYPKATLYRLLQTLTNQGMLAYEPADPPTGRACGWSGWRMPPGRSRRWRRSRGRTSTGCRG